MIRRLQIIARQDMFRPEKYASKKTPARKNMLRARQPVDLHRSKVKKNVLIFRPDRLEKSFSRKPQTHSRTPA